MNRRSKDYVLMSPSLQQLLADLLDAVQRKPTHDLLPVQRNMVYGQLGSATAPEGWSRRAWLAILTARRVLPLWQRERPDDTRAEALLALAETVLPAAVAAGNTEDRPEFAAAWRDATTAQRWLLDDYGALDREPSIVAYNAFGAIVQALFLALGFDPFEDAVLDEGDTDIDVDPWSSDTAEWASVAVAGPIAESDSDSAERLAFWAWWLTEAVPEAWAMWPHLDQ
jgi:hypothetical protein